MEDKAHKASTSLPNLSASKFAFCSAINFSWFFSKDVTIRFTAAGKGKLSSHTISGQNGRGLYYCWTVIIRSPKFAPPTLVSRVVRLTWSGLQTPAMVRKLRVGGSKKGFCRSQTQWRFVEVRFASLGSQRFV